VRTKTKVRGGRHESGSKVGSKKKRSSQLAKRKVRDPQQRSKQSKGVKITQPTPGEWSRLQIDEGGGSPSPWRPNNRINLRLGRFRRKRRKVNEIRSQAGGEVGEGASSKKNLSRQNGCNLKNPEREEGRLNRGAANRQDDRNGWGQGINEVHSLKEFSRGTVSWKKRGSGL